MSREPWHVFLACLLAGTLVFGGTLGLFGAMFGYGLGIRADGQAGDEYTAGAIAMCIAIAAQSDVDAAQARQVCPQLVRELLP
jgi:hypothetical protein